VWAAVPGSGSPSSIEREEQDSVAATAVGYALVRGPYVTNLDTDSWEPFVLEGGRVVGEIHLLRDEDGYTCGLWRVPAGEAPEPFPYEMAQNETIHVLEGELTIAVDGGPSVDLEAGDVASFTPGTKTTWRLRQVPFREVFVLS
jgi:uncharacterized cupin superfamily protein